MKKQRVYISIPISGLNVVQQRAKAGEKADYLKGKGYEVFNPFDVPEPPQEYNSDQKYAYYMGRDIEQLLLCDAIYMCKGWRDSKGCCIEHEIAVQRCMNVFYERTRR